MILQRASLMIKELFASASKGPPGEVLQTGEGALELDMFITVPSSSGLIVLMQGFDIELPTPKYTSAGVSRRNPLLCFLMQ
jgi:hypothetical protein